MINLITPTNSNRRKRSIPEPQVEPHTIHGGERAFLYQVKQGFEDELYDDHIKLPNCIIRFSIILGLEFLPFYIWPCFQYVEDYLFTFGMDGKGCLLRAICEMHESPLLGYGLVGELLEVFLT